MVKNILKLGIVLLLMFSVASLVACETFDLKEYKVEAKSELDIYLESKGNEHLGNWETILEVVVNSKQAIDDATSKPTVDAAVEKAKETINEMVVDDIVLQVKQTYVDRFLKDKHPEATVADVIVTRYLGTYNGSFVAVLNDEFNKYFTEYVVECKYEGFNFSYSNGYPIRVWNSGKFCDIPYAFKQELLTRENLQIIANLYKGEEEKEIVTQDKQEVSFSLDKGLNWQTADNYLTEFDVWNVNFNEEVPGMVFFYATSYEQLLEKVEKHKKTTFYSYRYLDNAGWNRLLATYNEEYFEDNILLFYYKYEPNISKNYVYNVVIKDNSLNLNINRFEGMATALSSWLHIVTVKKENIENITDFNVVVRTVSELRSCITLSPNDEYMRNIYVHGLSTSDFPGLNNLKSVNVWTWGVKIDIKFNETISADRLDRIVTILKTSENIRSVGYTSNTWIRVTIDNKFFDKYIDNTLTLDDVLENKIENSNKFTIDILKFTPIAIITLEMEQYGKDHAEAMIAQLKELNFPFINNEELN